MHFFSVIIQPFILIALGFLLSRLRMFPRSLWEGVEKLVYYVLFPPLLFNSVARAELTVSQTSLYLACGVGSMAAGMVLAWIVSKLAPADRLTDASIRQCGYRFNSYIGFAVVLALYGNTGMALFALLVGVWVPISNAVAVADLAAASQSEGSGIKGILKSIFTNPPHYCDPCRAVLQCDRASDAHACYFGIQESGIRLSSTRSDGDWFRTQA